MSGATSIDVHSYYRQITDVDIAQIARDLLAGRVTGETRDTLQCDCPNHQSQSHRSLHIWLDKQGWYCFGCGAGGDVLQLVEFIQCGQVTRGQSGRMPESHRRARDFLASRAGMPPLSKLSVGGAEDAEQAHANTIRVREALTELAEFYHQRLLATPDVLVWFREKYGISDETAARLKIGFAANTEPSAIQALMNGSGAFTKRELAATSSFRPTAQDGLVPFFDGRIVFPYWSRGRVVFMIGRQTPWTPDQSWEKSKYKKLAVQNERDSSHVAPCIQNDVLFNEDVLLTRPELVILTEGVTDCISLMEHGFPTVSPVTVQIREADWARLLPKLAGVKTVYICQDNEVSEAGMNGAMRMARTLAENGILTRLAVLPLGEKQQLARRELRDRFGVEGSVTPRELAKVMDGKGQDEIQQAQSLLADAKIDVNEYFAAGKTATDFEGILAVAQTPLELAISKLGTDTPDQNLSRALAPILAEVGRLDPIEQDRHLRLIQAHCGKGRIPVTTLRKQLKVVEIARPRRAAQSRVFGGGGPRGAAATVRVGEPEPVPLRDIQVNNRQLRDVIADAWAAIHATNEPTGAASTDQPVLFQKGGALVRITGTEVQTRIEALGETAIYGILARSANWLRVTEEGAVATPPSRDTARDMLENPDPTLPPLESVIRTPTFGKDAALITDPGYHRTDALCMLPDDSLEIPEVPTVPTPEQIAQARALLVDELLVDFPFVKDSDRAHAVAAILLPFLQRIIGGLAPMHLIEAPTQGSGKGLLASLISIVSTGAAPEGRTVPENEDEVRKMITAELITGRPIILLDNLSEKRKLDSSALASVLTVPWWTDRLLGESTMLHLRNNALWLMTGNNPRLSDEMSRRCIRLRIDPRIDMPWLRGGFKHPLIAEWAQENRSALVHSALILVQAWVAAGKPLHAKRLGSFEKWSGVMGGVLEVAGIPGFLGNLNELYEASDSDGQMWREFTGAWWEAYRQEPKKVTELNQFCEERDLMFSVRGDGSARSQQTRLGKALTTKRDRVFNGLTVKRISQGEHKHGVLYALVPADGGKPSGGALHRDPDLLDLLEGNLGDLEGNLTGQGSPSLDPIDPITYKDLGNLGNLGNLFPFSREEKKEIVFIGDVERECEKVIEEGGETGPEVPQVPLASATDTKHTSCVRGTSDAKVPLRFPAGSPARDSIAIDLAKLPEPSRREPP